MREEIWVLIDTVSTLHEVGVRVCGTTKDHNMARDWSYSRPTRNAIKVPMNGLADGEVL
jgi:hypothetical protein